MLGKTPIRIAAGLARAPGLLRTLLALTQPNRFLILCYHRVNDDAHPFFGGTPTRLFREQMQLLHARFAVLPLAELVARAASGHIPPNAVAITFDDGYRDNFSNAFPVLREWSLPATVYLVTDAVDTNGMIWHDRVFDAFHRTTVARAEIDGDQLPMTTTAERSAALARVLGSLRGSAPSVRDEAIDKLVSRLRVEPAPGNGWDKLTWDDVRAMQPHGIRFGAHTMDHPILSQVDSEEARRQIRGSKLKLESELDTPVDEFAYPNGRAVDIGSDTKRILAEEGFRSAVTTVDGPNDAFCDPLALRRVGMWGDDPYLSVLRLARRRRGA